MDGVAGAWLQLHPQQALKASMPTPRCPKTVRRMKMAWRRTVRLPTVRRAAVRETILAPTRRRLPLPPRMAMPRLSNRTTMLQRARWTLLWRMRRHRLHPAPWRALCLPPCQRSVPSCFAVAVGRTAASGAGESNKLCGYSMGRFGRFWDAWEGFDGCKEHAPPHLPIHPTNPPKRTAPPFLWTGCWTMTKMTATKPQWSCPSSLRHWPRRWHRPRARLSWRPCMPTGEGLGCWARAMLGLPESSPHQTSAHPRSHPPYA